jgi:hypothetical protein
MSVQPTQVAAAEAAKVLDDLAALSIDLSCHCDVAPHTLVLPAGKVREACDAIDDAVSSLKRILAIASATGSGPPLPPTP